MSPTPPEQLAGQLARLKRKKAGFDFAWKAAMRNVSWPDNTETRREWVSALEATRHEWEAAYVGSPSTVGPNFRLWLPSVLLVDETDRQPPPARTAPTDRINSTPPVRDRGRAAFVV